METLCFTHTRGWELLVQTAEDPQDQEWDRFLADIERHLPKLKGILVLTHGGKPTSLQRKRSFELFDRVGSPPAVAVMTNSQVAVGVVTVFNWFLQNRLKAFRMHAFEDAASFLSVPADERNTLRSTLVDQAARLGLSAP